MSGEVQQGDIHGHSAASPTKDHDDNQGLQVTDTDGEAERGGIFSVEKRRLRGNLARMCR